MDLNKLAAMVRERQTAIEAKKASGTKVAKFPSGTSRWRILPGWRPDDLYNFSHDFGQHWLKDANGKVAGVVVCEWVTYGRPCAFDGPIKDAVRSTTDDNMIKALKELNPNKVVLVNAVQIAMPAGSGGAPIDPSMVGVPVMLGLPNGVYEKFINLLGTRAVDDINVLDLAEGRDIIVTKSGVGMNTEYAVTDAAKNTAIDPGVMAKVTNIDAFIAAEFEKSKQVPIRLLNESIARILKIAMPTESRTASLVGAGATVAISGAGASAATALAPPPAAEVAAPALVNPVMPAPTVVTPAAPVVVAAAVSAADEDDLSKLLAELDL